MKRVEGTSLEGAYDCYLATEDNLSDLELATIEDWLKMMTRQIKERRRATRDTTTQLGESLVQADDGHDKTKDS